MHFVIGENQGLSKKQQEVSELSDLGLKTPVNNSPLGDILF